jgi:Tol biopolymer transport system component/DNA-binding winged helix-turn-helix (wHTH) protein
VTVHKSVVFSFGEFQIREGEFLLIKADEAAPVEPKAFRVLLYLLRNPGRLVTKDEILNAVWNDCSVSDNSLTRSVATLRRLLRDDVHEPRYIATVHTVGYRFLSPVTLTEDVVPEQGLAGSAAPPRMGSDTAGELKVTNERTVSVNKSSWAQVRRAGLGLALLAILFGSFLIVREPRQQTLETLAAVPSRMQFVPLTSLPGWARGPALSPDGERVAFFWNNETPATWNLYVQMVGGEKPLQLPHSHGGFLCCADWSPDGREIAFGRCDDDGGGVFEVPALGGTERKLTEVLCAFGDPGYSHWTPDGKSLLLADQCTSGTPRGIVLFSLSTGERRCLHAPQAGDVGDVDPVLSPDGRTVAFLRCQSTEMSEIYTAALSGGAIKELTHGGQGIYGLMWAADGKRIVFHKSGKLMHIAAGGGAIEPEIQYPASGSLSHDGRRMAYEEAPGFSQGSPTVWRAELSSPGGPVVSQRRILASAGFNDGTQLSLDGRQITFQSGRSGRTEIWKGDAGGNDLLQMTFFETGYAGTPRWSPDGKSIAFDYHNDRHTQIYIIDSEGRNPHSISSGNFENFVPSWSRDGQSVYFASNRTSDWQVWKHELVSGRETQITRGGGFAAFESYDAQTLFFSRFQGGGLWSVPIRGGEEQHIASAPHLGGWGQFAVTEAGIYLIDSTTEPGPTVFYYSFFNQQLTPVLMLDQDAVEWTSNLSASRDGRTVIYAQVEARGSILMADKLK